MNLKFVFDFFFKINNYLYILNNSINKINFIELFIFKNLLNIKKST